MNEAAKQSMVSLARESLGVPYVRDGRDLKKGLSCVGLITMAAKPQGAECPILSAASRHRVGSVALSDAIARDLQRINISEARTGDVVLFHVWSPWSAFISEHIALITGERPLTIIHATPFPIPEVIEHRLDAPMVEGIPTPWSFFVAGAYRFK